MLKFLGYGQNREIESEIFSSKNFFSEQQFKSYFDRIGHEGGSGFFK